MSSKMEIFAACYGGIFDRSQVGDLDFVNIQIIEDLHTQLISDLKSKNYIASWIKTEFVLTGENERAFFGLFENHQFTFCITIDVIRNIWHLLTESFSDPLPEDFSNRQHSTGHGCMDQFTNKGRTLRNSSVLCRALYSRFFDFILRQQITRLIRGHFDFLAHFHNEFALKKTLTFFDLKVRIEQLFDIDADIYASIQRINQEREFKQIAELRGLLFVEVLSFLLFQLVCLHQQTLEKRSNQCIATSFFRAAVGADSTLEAFGALSVIGDDEFEL